MHSYVIVPILACAISLATALLVWSRDASNRRVWPIASVSACAALWAFCEIAWHVATTREAALMWMRLSAFGWVPIGPAAFHALIIARDRDGAWTRGWISALYAVSLPLLAAGLASPLLIADARATWWGWSPEPGVGMLAQYLFTGGSVAAGLLLGWGSSAASADEVRRFHAVRFAIGVPLVVASATDILLPMLGVFDVPRFGTLSLAMLGGIHVWSSVRYGESILVPEGLTTRVLRSLPDGIASLTMTGHVRAVNDSLAALLGAPARALTGRDIADFVSGGLFTPPREFREVECRLLPRGGAPVDVSVSTLLHRDSRGEASGLILLVRDLREVVALRGRLLTSGRMAAVGELAAGIAHELNNPIAYVRSNLFALRERLHALRKGDDGETVFAEAQEILDESLEGMDRAATIVRDVREFSHAGSGERRAVNLHDLIVQSARVARLQMPQSARIVLALEGLPHVECDPQRLKQVFLNLLVNASQALRPDGTIEVSGTCEAGGVTLSFRDDGCGIAPGHLERIFDPFFTTKPVGVGTGLGLAIAFRILEEHRGRIDVRSEVGRGTEFRVWLPAEAAA